MRKIFLYAAALLLSASTQAQSDTSENPIKVRPFVAFGLTAGGDRLDSVEFENGSTQRINAGGLIHFQAGVDVHFDSPFSAQVNVGYHFDTVSGETSDGRSGRKTFDRYPVEVLGHWDLNDQWRLGGGVRWSTSPKFSSSGALDIGRNVEFEPSTGAVLEAEYFTTRNLSIKLRGVHEKYKLKGYATSPEYDGSHVGIYVGYYFN